MKIVDKYEHAVASHCETGTIRNLLKWSGCNVTESMVFGTGSGPAFYYLFFVKGPSGFPLLAVRNPPGSILKNLKKLWNLDIFTKKFRTTEEAIARANEMIDSGVPVAASVDMFYMKYLPAFLHIHAPFHFIVLVGREGDKYAVSDPYFDDIGELHLEDLKAAWATHAPMAKDNFLCYVENTPRDIDYKAASLKAINKTCKALILPPVFNKIFSFVGIEGMRKYAKNIPLWPNKHEGSFLREGILFNAVGFEDQGTGGGAFRLMYGAFLQEVGQLFGSSAINSLAEEMIDHGKKWRDISRLFIKIGKKIPLDDAAYAEWYATNEQDLREQLRKASDLFLERTAFEQKFFVELKKASSNLQS